MSKSKKIERVKWTKDEDQALLRIVREAGPKNWKYVATILGNTRTGNI